MSRIGKKPVVIPQGVKVTIDEKNRKITFESQKGKMETPIPPGIKVKVEGDRLIFLRENDLKQTRAYHGLARALANNAVIGLTRGFEKRLEVVGVGYRVDLKGKELHFALGYSHPIIYPIPDDVEITVEKPNKIIVRGIDKQRVGAVAAEIRSFREPDAYKGKGIRYEGEVLILKPGKSGVR
ncbi:MAG: 50S ribosomal protein L6 [Candidatus Aminicenantes bacterium]|nr:50S ribosomal protein L6 [Candidatus Aminicenantes bacterium]